LVKLILILQIASRPCDLNIQTMKYSEPAKPVQLEEIIEMEDGQHHILIMKFPLLDANKEIYGISGIATDITERVKYEEELIQAKKMAEDAKKMQEQFLANMSHEIRTPMNAIIGFTKVMLKTDLSAKQKEYLTAIKISGDALIVLINDILDLAKVEAGKMSFEKTPFKLAASISSMLHLFETKIQEKNLKLVKEYDDNIPGGISWGSR